MGTTDTVPVYCLAAAGTGNFARAAGVIVNNCGLGTPFSPFEPGWRGVVTVEIVNATPVPIEIFAWQGIAQAQFNLMAAGPEKSYAEKSNAKYQDQAGLTLPSVK